MKKKLSSWIEEKKFYETRLMMLKKIISDLDAPQELLEGYIDECNRNDADRNSRPYYLTEIFISKNYLKKLYELTDVKEDKHTIFNVMADTGEIAFVKAHRDD